MATGDRFAGNADLRRQAGTGGTRDHAAPIEVADLGNGRHRVRVDGFGECEADVGSDGHFNDAPFASGHKIHRARGFVEASDDHLSGGFTVERDGQEIARGRFDADKVHKP